MRKLFYLPVLVLILGLTVGCSGDSNGNSSPGNDDPPDDNGTPPSTSPGADAPAADLHEIVISWPIKDGIIEHEPGMYGRRGILKLSDRSGAPVVGAVVDLAVIDTILVYGVDGGYTRSGNQFVSNAPLAGNFTTPVYREHRAIYLNDDPYGEPGWLLVRDAEFSDRARHVTDITGPYSIGVNADFGETNSGRRYWAGVNSAGTAIVSHEDRRSQQVVTNEDGYAEFEVTYLVDETTLGHGCAGYDLATGVYLGADETRQLIVYAEARGEPGTPHRAVAVDERGCLAGREGAEVMLNPHWQTEFFGAGTHSIAARILDGGANPYPWQTVQATVTENSAGLAVSVEVEEPMSFAKGEGWAEVVITVPAGTPGSQVVVTIWGGDAAPEEITIKL